MWRRVKRFLRDVQLGRNWPGGAIACLMEAIIQQHPLGKSKFHAVDNHIFKRFCRPSKTGQWLAI